MSLSYTASRIEMIQKGVPEDYIDTLLDDAYMERLVFATEQLASKRDRKTRRYFRLQKLIFAFLVAQAVLGVFVAVYKTLLQPDYVFGSRAVLQDVDLVLMLDASRHMRQVIDTQHTTVKQFTAMLRDGMILHKERTRLKVEQRVEGQRKAHETLLSRFVDHMLEQFGRAKLQNVISVAGGVLRVATGTFNAMETHLLHDFTDDLATQDGALRSLHSNSYTSGAQWLAAMKKCSAAFNGRPKEGKQFCAIIGDNEAMCNRVEAGPVEKHCKKWKQFCPPEDEMLDAGNSLLEYSEEIEACTNYVGQELEHGLGLRLIMMFTVGSKEEEQLRLKNPSFQQFVEKTTACKILRRSEIQSDSFGNTRVRETYEQEANCLRFIMANGFDELYHKSQGIVSLLQDKVEDFKDDNPRKDLRFLFFLLLPLNLIFFIVWSKILRFTDTVTTQAKRAFGQKKKMIKVTKTLVEKVPPPDSHVERAGAKLTEVELAEVAALRSPVEFGVQVTLRARLKGGYIRSSPEGGADGHGHGFDPNSNWTFEPCEGEGGGVQVGQRVRLRNREGQLLVLGEEGAALVDDEVEASQLVLEPLEGQGQCHLGETLRLRCLQTGRLLRVHRDGLIDGDGDAEEPETQLVVDRGGQLLHSGSVVTMRNEANGCLMQAMPDGRVLTKPSEEPWRFWRIERQGEASREGAVQPLRQGDVVTLTGFNQQKLEALSGGRVRCGPAPALPALAEEGESNEAPNAQEGEGEAAPAPPPEEPGSWQRAFVVERVAMGLAGRRDPAIRAGARVLLRPVGASEEERAHLRAGSGGAEVSADGSATGREAVFQLELARLQDLLMPLHGALHHGDVDLLVSPLWNKSDTTKVNAMTASWTSNEDLEKFQGPVVVASEKGTYIVPKMREGDQGWIAVVGENVDLPKAARQAKLQGACGLIVRCEDVLSLHRMPRSMADQPELPAIFVDKTTSESLDERGIVLTGVEQRRRYVADVMRALDQGQAKGADAMEEIFRAAGSGMVEWSEERAKAAQEREREEREREEDEVQREPSGQYKWKVSSNTHYLWSGGAGGVTRMDVNYGAALPPAAVREQRLGAVADASASRALPQVQPQVTRRTVVIDPSSMRGNRLAQELEEVMMESAEDPGQLEQLPEESDFKINYVFEEVFLAPGEKPEELEEEELMDDEGVVIAKLGVPMRHFWLVAIGLTISTSLLIALLYFALHADFGGP